MHLEQIRNIPVADATQRLCVDQVGELGVAVDRTGIASVFHMYHKLSPLSLQDIHCAAVVHLTSQLRSCVAMVKKGGAEMLWRAHTLRDWIPLKMTNALVQSPVVDMGGSVDFLWVLTESSDVYVFAVKATGAQLATAEVYHTVMPCPAEDVIVALSPSYVLVAQRGSSSATVCGLHTKEEVTVDLSQLGTGILHAASLSANKLVVGSHWTLGIVAPCEHGFACCILSPQFPIAGGMLERVSVAAAVMEPFIVSGALAVIVATSAAATAMSTKKGRLGPSTSLALCSLQSIVHSVDEWCATNPLKAASAAATCYRVDLPMGCMQMVPGLEAAAAVPGPGGPTVVMSSANRLALNRVVTS